ncbi:hypothetical protein [Sabulibacter ruber]|uniref:hypothetical protein n=1 Tax=Sabulibacter ruber TaxID=2811901 RepID=UPI001A9798E7|nr:hypothetical protein [Sabulibacter ruber]
MQLEQFTDIKEAVAYLRQQGYEHVFECCPQGWRQRKTGLVFCPEKMQMENCQRFQKCGGVHNVTVLYMVLAPDGSKGVIIDDCTTYGDALFGEYLVRMKLRHINPDQQRQQPG